MKKLSRYKENREELKALSKMAKALVKEGAFDSVNEAIIEMCYMKDGHEQFFTLPEWNKKGFKVKKGSHAFVVWGRPKAIALEEQSEPGPDAPDDDETEKEKFWPLCYLFSNLQVEPLAEERRAA